MNGRIGRKVRLLRARLGRRQRDLAERARVSRGLVSLIERDRAVTIGAAQRVADALEARLIIDVQWSGAELDRLLDAGHAALAEWLAAFLGRFGWDVRVEVSFNHFGDRGRYDLLAFHAATGVLLVVEVKTAIGDLQDLLGRLDVKLRLGRTTASSLGWHPSSIVPLLLLADGTTNRRRTRQHPTLFGRFALRGAQASAWLRHPDPAVRPGGLLLFRKVPNANHGDPIGLRRIRKPHMQTTAASGGSEGDAAR
ncbi:MAG: helix-turn-helix domain-containing protein [Chloroflexota bacterium]